MSSDEVAEKWERGWGVLFGALSEVTDDDLAAPVTIRGVGSCVPARACRIRQ